MTGPSSGKRQQPGGMWLLAPAACCAGSLLAAGLATAGTLAWGGLGLAVGTLLVSALAVMQRRRARGACAARSERR